MYLYVLFCDKTVAFAQAPWHCTLSADLTKIEKWYEKWEREKKEWDAYSLFMEVHSNMELKRVYFCHKVETEIVSEHLGMMLTKHPIISHINGFPSHLVVTQLLASIIISFLVLSIFSQALWNTAIQNIWFTINDSILS